MASPEPLVRFYDLSGPKPWSPACWRTRYALNYKRIPYTVTTPSYPSIAPTCTELFPSITNLTPTVPIIEILSSPYAVLNDSTPIAELLNERFTEEDGFRDLEGIEEMKDEDKDEERYRAIFRWICCDVWRNALDGNDGSKEYFRKTREERLGVRLEDVLEVKGGGEEKIIEGFKVQWEALRERMSGGNGKGEPTYVDFCDASLVKWIQAASEEKAEKLMNLYGDGTFVKLMNKVKDYEA